MEGIFLCKQFQVKQSREVFKVNTDGLLLGAWTKLEENSRVLDIGTGTGIIALLLAQRFQDATITAIDHNQWAVNLAHENFAASPWKERLCVNHLSAHELIVEKTHSHFEHIVSNPPFFSRGILPKSAVQRISKHQAELSIETLCKVAQKVLVQSGKLTLILPLDIYERSTSIFAHHGFYPLRETLFMSKENRPKRILLTFSKSVQRIQSSSLVQYNEDGSYHTHYILLMRDFLTIF
jgi:tRNA1Val (adenine37-N6)-methyltransferase